MEKKLQKEHKPASITTFHLNFYQNRSYDFLKSLYAVYDCRFMTSIWIIIQEFVGDLSVYVNWAIESHFTENCKFNNNFI